MAEEKSMKSGLADRKPFENLRNAEETQRRTSSRSKLPWPITALVAVFSLLAWWLFARDFLGAQHFFSRGPTSEVTENHKVTRQYNLTIGARWMNLGESLEFSVRHSWLET